MHLKTANPLRFPIDLNPSPQVRSCPVALCFSSSRRGNPAVDVDLIEVYENWKRQRKMFFDAIRNLQEANKDVDPEHVWDDVLQAQQAVRSPGL